MTPVASSETLRNQVRTVWFNGGSGLNVYLPRHGDVYVGRDSIEEYGGPKMFTRCLTCAVMEWMSRITRHNQFTPHACSNESKLGIAKVLCKRAADLNWTSTLKNYDFTLGVDPRLGGLRGLLAWGGHEGLVVKPGADRGSIDYRQRLSPFQVDIHSACNPLPDLSKYDFVFQLCRPPGPKIKRSKTGPKILMYGHDHHKHHDGTQYLLDMQPHALFTPYPTIWKKYYRIHPNTELVFAPFLTTRFFTDPITDFTKKMVSLLVTGTAGVRCYPERNKLVLVMQKAMAKHPDWVLHAKAHSGIDYRKGCNKIGSYRLLNLWNAFLTQAKVMAFGQDRWGYLVRKYSEAFANCCVLICPKIPDLHLLGLKPGVHYIPLKRPVEKHFVSQAQHVIANLDAKYIQVAMNGYDWFQKYGHWWLFTKFEQDIRRIVGYDR